MQRGLHSRAYATQAASQTLRTISQALGAQSSPACLRQPLVAGKERLLLPACDKGSYPFALDAGGQLLVLALASHALPGIGDTGGGAFQDEGAEETGEGTVERDTSTQRVAEENGLGGGNPELPQGCQQIGLAVLHAVALGSRGGL